ncbi:MAG: VanZ family protein [Clostridia bacterium]|nr:VanZ family protein [Clostridia bacterium]
MNRIFYGKHRKRNIVVYFVILLLWLSFIFYNSSASGLESTEQSNRVVEFIQSIVHNFAPEAMVDSGAVRTTAHFVEFFVLGALYYIGTFFIRFSRTSLFIHSLALSLFSAFADETVQMFSNGRGAEIKDVWVDLAGAFVAHIIIFAIYYSYKHFKNTSQ